MVKKNKKNRIKCISCLFTSPDKTMSDRKWTAYECGNPESVYYKALVNVDPYGNKMKRITWIGCKYGKRRYAK